MQGRRNHVTRNRRITCEDFSVSEMGKKCEGLETREEPEKSGYNVDTQVIFSNIQQFILPNILRSFKYLQIYQEDLM